uniref:Uncharacterized protein n=1 Tax=Arundo donax TaxID=35708 RepID=A0A0A9AUU6_ARUDO
MHIETPKNLFKKQKPNQSIHLESNKLMS